MRNAGGRRIVLLGLPSQNKENREHMTQQHPQWELVLFLFIGLERRAIRQNDTLTLTELWTCLLA
jgi:hypothetical protein